MRRPGLFTPIVFAVLLCTVRAGAQELRDTLKEVNKRASRGSTRRLNSNGIRVLSADSATLATYRNRSVATLLSQQFPVFVRTYGTNGLATLSLRGASAAQTSVQWNGVPLQNGATGLVDLLLLPVALFDRVDVGFGKGGIGGTLLLQSDIQDFKNERRLELSSGAGSFNTGYLTLKARCATAHWTTSAMASIRSADNNFGYMDASGERTRMTNAKARDAVVQLSVGRKLNNQTTLQAALWGDLHTRYIPPALFEIQSVKKQQDGTLRTNLVLAHGADTNGYEIRGSVIDEWFRYTDLAAALNTNIHTRQYFASPAFHKYFKDRALKLSLALPQQLNVIVGEARKKVGKSALTGELSKRGHRISWNGNARAELVNGKLFAAGVMSADLQLHQAIGLRAAGGYNYRTPTLNELYYTPGGNDQLLPEKGWNGEAGYHIRSTSDGALAASHTVTAYYRDIDNWILWFGGAIWTPHNIARAISRGFETENKLTWSRPKIKWQLIANGTYVSSRTKESKIPGDGSIGRQIPYAPHWIGQGNIGFTTAHLSVNYNQTYTGRRYYNTDETGELAAYALGNIQAGYYWTKKRWGFNLNAQLNNVWDHRYLEVSGRPAPGFNWLLGITISESSGIRN